MQASLPVPTVTDVQPRTNDDMKMDDKDKIDESSNPEKILSEN